MTKVPWHDDDYDDEQSDNKTVVKKQDDGRLNDDNSARIQLSMLCDFTTQGSTTSILRNGKCWWYQHVHTCTTIVIIVVQSSDKLNHARGSVKIQMCDTIGSGYSWLQSQAGHLTWEAEYSCVTSVDHNLTFTSKRDAGRDGYG